LAIRRRRVRCRHVSCAAAGFSPDQGCKCVTLSSRCLSTPLGRAIRVGKGSPPGAVAAGSSWTRRTVVWPRWTSRFLTVEGVWFRLAVGRVASAADAWRLALIHVPRALLEGPSPPCPAPAGLGVNLALRHYDPAENEKPLQCAAIRVCCFGFSAVEDGMRKRICPAADSTCA